MEACNYLIKSFKAQNATTTEVKRGVFRHEPVGQFARDLDGEARHHPGSGGSHVREARKSRGAQRFGLLFSVSRGALWSGR